MNGGAFTSGRAMSVGQGRGARVLRLVTRWPCFLSLAVGLVTSFAVGGFSAEPTAAQREFFENRIRPVLANHCYKCHSAQAEKVKGGLLLDTRHDLLKGGDAGPAVVPGYPDRSLLIRAVQYTDPDLQMPPKGEKLSTAQVNDLVAWVRMGVPDPRTEKTANLKSQIPHSQHWAFQPVKKPAVPEVKQTDWPASPMDAFILAKLEASGMQPSPPADKRTLIRRVTFDLTGLPPRPAEVQAYLDDASADAFARVVDRLLASPQYGERWGRHWLDIARYADTKGEVKKNREDIHYPHAWTYRDYVIQAFNDDKPFHHFIIEQLAADRLPPGKDNSRLAALGFLTLGNRFNNNPNDIINDRIDAATKGFLGLTVACARCHDHKFDPIPTRDYYSLHGVFASSREPAEDPALRVVERTPEFLDYQRQRVALDTELKSLKAQFKALRGKAANTPAAREARKELQKRELQTNRKISGLEMTHKGAPPRANVLVDSPKAVDSPVFIRGEAGNKGDVVPRQFLEALSGPNRLPFKNGSGRLEFAQAIASKSNPLTARVLVNRVWLHHFGEGFVTTPDDFGTQSAPPSHPELLDWLAAQFMDDGWSLKKLHRAILLSRVYQQGSANNVRYAQLDANNRLLWRANIRRLEFEPLRDSLLAIGGKLDGTMFGQPVDLAREPYSTRRTVYGMVDRNNLPEVLNHFDFANPDMTTGKRYETTVPQQALFLMNSPLVVEQAKNLVHRNDFTALADAQARIGLLYALIYQRPAKPEEITIGLAFLKVEPSREQVAPIPVANPALRNNPKAQAMVANNPKLQRRLAGKATFIERAPLNAWEEYAHALLQANEASFVN